MSGTIGMGGGLLLLAFMGQYFPLQTLIPVHSYVQLGSNFSRSIMSVKFINRRITWLFAGGSIFGAVLGIFFGNRVFYLNESNYYKLVLGIFILIITFFKLPSFKKQFLFKWPIVGALSTFLGIFVGATGPLIAPFYLNDQLEKESLVATKAACQVFTHLFKIFSFTWLGFSVIAYCKILALLFLAVVIGNYIGKKILGKIPDYWFFVIFKGLILVLSLRMILQGTGIL